jgi:hypothetical protein
MDLYDSVKRDWDDFVKYTCSGSEQLAKLIVKISMDVPQDKINEVCKELDKIVMERIKN